MCRVKVAVIDREGFYIDAVMSVLEQQPDMEVVASATIFEDFVAQAAPAEIVVLQQEQSIHHTRRLIRELSEELPDAAIVLLGATDDTEILVSYIEAGAIGYVRDSESFDQLMQIIRIIRAGETSIHPELAAPLARRLAELGRIVGDLIPMSPEEIELTDRQHEVMGLIVDGRTNQEIAEELYISVGTVKNHVHKIFERLQVTSRDQAAVVYQRYLASARDGNSGAGQPNGVESQPAMARGGNS